MNSAGNVSTKTGFRVLLFKVARLNGKRPSKAGLTVGHKSLTSSTENQFDKALIESHMHTHPDQ